MLLRRLQAGFAHSAKHDRLAGAVGQAQVDTEHLCGDATLKSLNGAHLGRRELSGDGGGDVPGMQR